MTPIEGADGGTFDQAQAWARSRGAAECYVDNAPRYWWFCSQAGLRPEVLYAHHGKETNLGRFGGVLDESFHNCAGIKIAAGGGDYVAKAHEQFANWDEGVRAHVNHMLAYVYGRSAVFIGEPHARARIVQTTPWAGTIKRVEDLDARWAPSPTYGRDLVRLFLQPLLDHSESVVTTRASWLPEVLADAGCTMVSVPGWETRGRDMAGVYAIIWHHTATGPKASDQNVANLLRDGRSDLPGPLSQLGLDRHGRYWVVAAGKGNHNGSGKYGNNSIGIEAMNDGVGEPWPTAQLDAYVRGTAAILDHLNLSTDRVLAHRESDPTRKSDPRGIDMVRARQRVDAHRHKEDDDMTPEQADQLGRVHHELVAEQATVRELVAQSAYRTAELDAKVDKLLAAVEGR